MNEFDLLNGDCLELLKTIPDNSVDMVLTDPPYFCGMTHNGEKAVYSDMNLVSPFFEQLFLQWKRVLKPNGLVYMFSDWRTVSLFMPILNRHIEIRNMLVWHKKTGRPSKNYGFKHELVLFAGHSERKITRGSVITDVADFAGGAKKTNGDRVHPAQKPIELLQQFIVDGTDAGEVVLDCFMGSGSTGVACANTGRKFIGMEIDEKYFNIAKDRIYGQPKSI